MTNENGKTKYYVLMEELKQSILSGEIRPAEMRGQRGIRKTAAGRRH